VAWTIESVRDAPVGAAAVFALYENPKTWSRWGHNATRAEADGPLREGGIVRVRAGYGTVYRCLVRRIEPDRALELVVRPTGLTIINTYEVAPMEKGSRIRHAFEISGPLAGITRPLLAGTYRRRLDAEVAAVVAMAADPAAMHAAAAPDRTVSGPERIWHRIGRILRGGREEQRH
jgi:hypothetical protein